MAYLQCKKVFVLKDLKVIAYTFRNCTLDEVGSLVIDKSERPTRLKALKEKFNFGELFYIATCNRVEFIFSSEKELDSSFAKKIIKSLFPDFTAEQHDYYSINAAMYANMAALEHLMRISCSLESLVVGEKEILAQIREMYEECRDWGLTGDSFRLIMNRVVKASKEVYTNTKIAEKPVSVASLACRSLRMHQVNMDAKFLIIGAGETIQLITKYLQKHNLKNCVIFNRTLSKAQILADELKAKALPLDELKNYKGGFDVILTCTGATEPIITPEIFEGLVNGSTDKKIILDLALPNDTAPEVIEQFNPVFISVQQIQEIASRNLEERRGELVHAERIIEENILEFIPILKQRRVELAMREVPEKIKEIKVKAVESVFANEINSLDENSREVLEKVLNYVEKKYISVPMVMAKEILMQQ
ncbi:glutamyl-tRNA reductase [Solitalea canadensis DSM 3403]|uniref:Glutamyl-tRNA reductase n=1 Tax=Solitalea canadensis (strain ATCC 29591 / DSM 3403 / JCM 21819 / LMG 8368 / NBRC 15130 / NCIMB 12057 / USAM 9D) TaxID=929556 RepID=H8KS50_SOLCM|nr:glutamyl-tRNA reductase [Solitalea canadensis DSM 3403]